MPELDDLSGPFNPELTFADFSKGFLLKLIQVWQYAWLHMTEGWYDAVKERWGSKAADECETQAWVRMGSRVNPRLAKVANIQLNTVVVLTVQKCRSLEFFEAHQPERIYHVCHVNEKQVMEKYLVNPDIKVTPLKLPPRQSPDDVACQWEFKL